MFESGFQELLDEFLLEARERADQVETLLLQLTSGSDKERSLPRYAVMIAKW